MPVKSPWRWRGLVVVVGGFLVGAALSPALVGCVPENSSLRRMVQSVGGSGGSLPAEADRELIRFAAVYRDVAADPNDTRELKQFKDAFVRVRNDYLRPVNDRSLIDAAIKGVTDLKAERGTVPADKVVEAGLDAMVASLDPHSSYLNPEHCRSLRHHKAVRRPGIEVTVEDGSIKIVSPIEGRRPIRRSQVGRLITTDAARFTASRSWMRQAMRASRTDSAYHPASATSRLSTSPTPPSSPSGGPCTSRTTSGHPVASSRADGGKRQRGGKGIARSRFPMKGLILDLRNKPALLDESLELADIFLEKGRIVEVRSRDVGNRQIFSAKAGDEAKGAPMVVLINGGSASASEIVASALQEDGRAIVMGTPSFGKGSVQTIMPLPIKGALKLTTALYYAPSGRTIQGLGVMPDIIIAGAETPAGQRESDLPGALAAGEQTTRVSLGTVAEESCPIPPGGEDDRQLGCAVSFLKAGSAERFLASVPAGARL